MNIEVSPIQNGETEPLSAATHTEENDRRESKVKSQGEIEEDEAPDGGYGWMIVFCSFMVQLVIAVPLSYGIFYVELLETFEKSNSDTAWPGSIGMGLCLAAGPLASILCNKLGHRLTCILGGLVAAAGIFSSAFVQDLYLLNLTYGVLGGVGLAMSYVASVVMVGFYFKKKLSMANGLAISGVGVGEMIFPPLLRLLIDTYTWRGCLIIAAGVTLNIVVLGALLRPIGRVKRPGKDSDIFETSLFKEWKFVLCVIIDILWNIGSLIYVALIVDHAVMQGVDKDLAALLPTYIGAGALAGKLIIAFATSCKCCNHLFLYGMATVISGIPLFFPAVDSSYGFLVCYSVAYGFCFGIQLGMLPVITVELFGLHRLTSAYGYLMFGDGVGCIIGPPIGGFIFDVTKSYNMSFIFGGAVSVFAGFLVLVIVLVRYHEGEGDPGGRRKSPPQSATDVELTT